MAALPLLIWLLGKTGDGKSSTGNTILGKEVFEHHVSAGSTTREPQSGENVLRGQRYVKVVDLPGFYDTDDKHHEKAVRNVWATTQMTKPGPNAVLFVISITARFTEEEYKTFQRVKMLFDNEITNHMIVVFTRKDELDAENKTVEEYMATAPNFLKMVLKECGKRYVFLNNRADDDAQVDTLLEKIDSISIGEAFYRNPYQNLSVDDQIKRVREKLALSEKEEVERTSYYQSLTNTIRLQRHLLYTFGVLFIANTAQGNIVGTIAKGAKSFFGL